VHDTVTNLIWLREPLRWEFFSGMNYADANDAASSMEHGIAGLTDGSSKGDWRLPTKEEWEAAVQQAVALGCEPSQLNTAGTVCLTDDIQEGPFPGPYGLKSYWSSTTSESSPDYAWIMDLMHGHMKTVKKTSKDPDSLCVWPVRSAKY
jgi:hypothetical protein